MMRAACLLPGLLGVTLVATAAQAQRAADSVRPDQVAGSVGAGDAFRASTAVANALRLARLLNDNRVLADLLEQTASRLGATMGELADAVAALEEVGEPTRARRLLQARLQRSPGDAAARVALAELLVRMGQSADAVTVFRALETREGGPGLGPEQADEYARALCRTGDAPQALRVLSESRFRASDGVPNFWDDLASLAWQLGHATEALEAHRRLWAAHDRRHVVAARLVQLAREAGATDEANAVGLEDFGVNGEASSLLEVAQSQSDAKDWAATERTLSLADPARDEFGKSETYWTLRGEVAARRGDSKAARTAFEAALAIEPGASGPKSALLWAAIDQDDGASLRTYVTRWRSIAPLEEPLWEPFAIALDRLGLTREALTFFARQQSKGGGDPAFELEFAEALDRSGYGTLAFRVRRSIAAALRALVSSPAPGDPGAAADERHLVEEAISDLRATAGRVIAERWTQAMRRSGRWLDASGDALVIDECLADERFDCARALLARNRGARDSRWNGFRLQLALADDDAATLHDLLAKPDRIDNEARIDALVALEDDPGAASAIGDALASRDDVAPPGGELEATWLQTAAEIRLRHAPGVRAGATYEFVDGLDAWGPDVGALVDGGPARWILTASGRQMGVRDGSLRLGGTVQEGSALVVARVSNPRGVTELGAGANIQPTTGLPRLSFFDERLITASLGSTLQIAVDDAIDETGLLRVAAAQSIAEAGLREDDGPLYAQLDVHAREDHTRHFNHLAFEVGEVAEAGVKILSILARMGSRVAGRRPSASEREPSAGRHRFPHPDHAGDRPLRLFATELRARVARDPPDPRRCSRPLSPGARRVSSLRLHARGRLAAAGPRRRLRGRVLGQRAHPARRLCERGGSVQSRSLRHFESDDCASFSELHTNILASPSLRHANSR